MCYVCQVNEQLNAMNLDIQTNGYAESGIGYHYLVIRTGQVMRVKGATCGATADTVAAFAIGVDDNGARDSHLRAIDPKAKKYAKQMAVPFGPVRFIDMDEARAESDLQYQRTLAKLWAWSTRSKATI